MSQGSKTLYRSKDEVMVAGVCGGLAEYFNVDPTIVRVLFVLLAFMFGGGILTYLFLWVIMPQHPDAVA